MYIVTLKQGRDPNMPGDSLSSHGHLAGVRRAKKVVVGNKDAKVPIFKASHVAGDGREDQPAIGVRVRELQE